jgi:hypothetical protein
MKNLVYNERINPSNSCKIKEIWRTRFQQFTQASLNLSQIVKEMEIDHIWIIWNLIHICHIQEKKCEIRDEVAMSIYLRTVTWKINKSLYGYN